MLDLAAMTSAMVAPHLQQQSGRTRNDRHRRPANPRTGARSVAHLDEPVGFEQGSRVLRLSGQRMRYVIRRPSIQTSR